MPDKEEIIFEIKEIISRISRIDASELEENIVIRDELGVDSLMAMEIIATCEKQLDIHIDEGILFEIETIGDFINLIVKLYEQKHGSCCA